MVKPFKIPDNAPPLLRALMEEIILSEKNLKQVCREAGIAESSFNNWKRKAPSLYSFEAAANVVGMELKLVRRKVRWS